MSGKALFYFILKCSPQVEKVMMSKYLENPLNTMMFVEYDQRPEDFTSKDVSELHRIMHLDHANNCTTLWGALIGMPGLGQDRLD